MKNFNLKGIFQDGTPFISKYNVNIDRIWIRDYSEEQMKLKSIDLTPLKDCKELKALYLSSNALETLDLSPLQHCTNLEALHLDQNQLVTLDLTPLGNCKKFKELHLNQNELVTLDLTPLENCKKMNYLHLDQNNLIVIDLTPLQHCSGLLSLQLDSEPLIFASESLQSFSWPRYHRGVEQYRKLIIWDTSKIEEYTAERENALLKLKAEEEKLLEFFPLLREKLKKAEPTPPVQEPSKAIEFLWGTAKPSKAEYLKDPENQEELNTYVFDLLESNSSTFTPADLENFIEMFYNTHSYIKGSDHSFTDDLEDLKEALSYDDVDPVMNGLISLFLNSNIRPHSIRLEEIEGAIRLYLSKKDLEGKEFLPRTPLVIGIGGNWKDREKEALLFIEKVGVTPIIDVRIASGLLLVNTRSPVPEAIKSLPNTTIVHAGREYEFFGHSYHTVIEYEDIKKAIKKKEALEAQEYLFSLVDEIIAWFRKEKLPKLTHIGIKRYLDENKLSATASQREELTWKINHRLDELYGKEMDSRIPNRRPRRSKKKEE